MPQVTTLQLRDSWATPVYTGPGDLPGYNSAGVVYAYWGMRAFTAAYATSLGPCFDVTDDLATVGPFTIHMTATGDLNLTELTATGIAVGHQRIVKLYDQSGNGRHLTNVNPPVGALVVLSGIGFPKPVMDLSSGSYVMVGSGAAAALSMPYVYSTVFRSHFGSGGGIFSTGNFSAMLYTSVAAGHIGQSDGTTNQDYSISVADDVWCAVSAVYGTGAGASTMNACNATFNSAGTTFQTGNAGTPTFTDGVHKLTLGAMTDGPSVPCEGQMLEFMITQATSITQGHQTAMIANQRLYGGNF